MRSATFSLVSCILMSLLLSHVKEVEAGIRKDIFVGGCGSNGSKTCINDFVKKGGLANKPNSCDCDDFGIEPHVTLFHYDHPQYLEDEYGGWINRRIIEDFTAYADVCFREFGHHVKFWTTINEANVFTTGGYNDGITSPSRCSSPGGNCFIYAIAPWAMENLESVLEYIKQTYGKSPVYVHENGTPMKQDMQLQQNDTTGIEYLHAYIGAVLKAVRNGSDTRGYFVWSFMDLYELVKGYEFSFGLYSVNFSDPHRKRFPKLSAHWYSAFLKGNITFFVSKGITQLQSKLLSSDSS